VIRLGEPVFVDTGAWIGLAVSSDPDHAEALRVWTALIDRGAKPCTSAAVVLETFTYLQRNTRPDVALAWLDALEAIPRLLVFDVKKAHVDEARSWLARRDLHRLSAVDAVSFVLMKEHRVTLAFAFDSHFGQAGFRIAG